MRSQVFRFVSLAAVLCGGAGVIAACSSAPGTESVSPVITNGVSSEATVPTSRVGRFVGYFDRDNGEFKIARNVLGADVTIQSVDQLTQNQYVLADGGGSPTANSVDLVTTGYSDPYPTTKSFSATVELRSFYTQNIANVYVDIDAITLPDGGDGKAYKYTDTAPTNPLALPSNLGLWNYNNGSTNASGSTSGGFLSANPSLNTGTGNWTATQTWDFNNPKDLNIVYDIQVFASLGYSSYTQTFGASSWTEVCPAQGGSGTAQGTTNKLNIPLGFDFTLYNTHMTAVNIADVGEITPSTTTLTASGSSTKLPSTSAPEPVFFAFWDKLTAGKTNGAQMCTATTGTAPNRKFIVEWHAFDFNSKNTNDGPNLGASLTFEAILYEGTNQIDTVYNNMVGAPGGTAGREEGSKATTGMQDSTGTISTSDFNENNFTYATGDAWSYIPDPLSRAQPESLT